MQLVVAWCFELSHQTFEIPNLLLRFVFSFSEFLYVLSKVINLSMNTVQALLAFVKAAFKAGEVINAGFFLNILLTFSRYLLD